MRSRISRTQSYFDTNIVYDCNGKKESITLNMESIALYIHSINGVDLSDDVERYTDDNVELNIDNYRKVFADAVNFAKLTKKQQQDVVKYFAFLVAESARFEDIDNAANKLMTSSCSYEWMDYMDLVRRWKTMSIFTNSQGLAKGTQHIGGYRAFLIAPITSSTVQQYNKATTNGWEVVRYQYGSRQIDKASPISVGKPECK